MSSSVNIIKIYAGSIRNKLKEQVTHQVDHNIPIKEKSELTLNQSMSQITVTSRTNENDRLNSVEHRTRQRLDYKLTVVLEPS